MDHVPFEPSRPQQRPAAVLCDVMGTVLRLDRPVERLRGALSARGVQVTHEEAVRALTAEVKEYRAHHLEGTDMATVTDLRRRCADALRAELPQELDHERAYSVLMGMLRFTVLPGTVESLGRLRAAGIRVAVVSNWDASLEATMLAVGLRTHLDAVVSSAGVGVAKPDPAPLVHALELLGEPAERAVMIGDHEVDAEAARALDMPCSLVEPGGGIVPTVDEILALPA